jgi:multicomponent Na+:H+ antiporter subunit E
VLKRSLAGLVLTFLLWLALSGGAGLQEVVAGLAVAVLVTVLSWRQLALFEALRPTPLLPWHLLHYLAVFLATLLRANLDMARRVLAPSLPIRPGMVEVQTSLTSDLGRLLLANSITLTPGTLTVDVTGDRLRVHWIDVTPGADLETATAAIAARLERPLRAFLQ